MILFKLLKFWHLDISYLDINTLESECLEPQWPEAD